MKVIAIGDIHGRTIWKDIVNQEFDLCVFLGDYVDSHDNIPAKQQIDNLLDILEFKEHNSNKVILLRGNHDDRALGYYWAKCSPSDPEVNKLMEPHKERFLKDTQWVYIKDNMLFSHAGVSSIWLENSEIQSVKYINNYLPSEIFGFTPKGFHDYSGTSVTQPPTWIRPQTLMDCAVVGYTQIVGHTPVRDGIPSCTSDSGDAIYLCDSLANSYYLIIDDNNFIPTKL